MKRDQVSRCGVRLFRKHYARARRMSRTREDAEDLLMDAYVVMLRYATEEDPDFSRRFGGVLKVLSWSVSYRRKDRREDDHVSIEDWDCPDVDSMERTTATTDLLLLIRRLPVLQRQALMLFASGYSQKEIADHFDTRPETINTRIQEARKKLHRWSA